MPNTPRYLVAFDFDGTLFNTFTPYQAFEDAFSRKDIFDGRPFNDILTSDTSLKINPEHMYPAYVMEIR